MRYLIIPYLIFLCALYSCNKKPLAAINLINPQIKIKCPDGPQAGNEIWLILKTENKDQVPIEFIIDNGLTSRSINGYTNKKLILTNEQAQVAGLYNIYIIYANELVAKRSLFINPQNIVDPIDVYTGPNTIVVDHKQPSMVVSLPADKYDNPILKDDPIEYKFAQGLETNTTENINQLYSATQFSADKQAEKIIIGSSFLDASSKEQRVDAIADWPTAFSIEIVSHYPVADNRQYLRIRTSNILDEHSNKIPDGTMVVFEVFENSNKVAKYQAYTIDGTANVYIRNPAISTNWIIKANIAKTAFSNKLDLQFKSNLKELTYHYNLSNNKIFIGPLKGQLGQYISDGTKVYLQIGDEHLVRETEEGKTMFDLNLTKYKSDSSHTATLKVLDHQESILVNARK